MSQEREKMFFSDDDDDDDAAARDYAFSEASDAEVSECLSCDPFYFFLHIVFLLRSSPSRQSRSPRALL